MGAFLGLFWDSRLQILCFLPQILVFFSANLEVFDDFPARFCCSCPEFSAFLAQILKVFGGGFGGFGGSFLGFLGVPTPNFVFFAPNFLSPKEDSALDNVWLMGGLSILSSVPVTAPLVCLLCASKGLHKVPPEFPKKIPRIPEEFPKNPRIQKKPRENPEIPGFLRDF